MNEGRAKDVRAKRPRKKAELLRRRNPQIYRLQSAVRFFEKWEDDALIEKAGNLAGRLLAINKVSSDRGRPIMAESIMNALLALYTQYTPSERIEPYRRKERGAKEDEDRGPAEPE